MPANSKEPMKDLYGLQDGVLGQKVKFRERKWKFVLICIIEDTTGLLQEISITPEMK